ncbi:hypothetical protein [Agaribacter flavus]|uniref:Uncharacterized protein n=1 Tax=Agaribacter flavus TaxID=1902781 RepID=A0ABV7FPQ2_9ALTE
MVLPRKIHRAFVLVVVDGEDIDFGDFTGVFDVKDFIGDFIIGQVDNASIIEVKARQRGNAKTAVEVVVVVVFNPRLGELI